MKFEKTQYGWKAYRKHGNAWIYCGHYLTQRAAKQALKQGE